MVAIEHRQKPTTTTATTTPTPTTTPITTPTSSNPEDLEQQQQQEQEQEQQLQEHQHEPEADQAPEPPQQPGSDEPGEEEEQAEEEEVELEVEAVIKTTTNTSKNKMSKNELESAELAKRHREAAAAAIAKSAVSQRGVELKIGTGRQAAALDQELAKKVLKLDLTGPELDEYALKSPKSPISARLPHQTSLTSSVDVEDRKTLREALYQGIFHRHRRTIFAVGSFLRMLRSRNSQYNTIRSSSEGEDMDEAR